MKNKLFTLVHGDQIEVNPGTKIIPASSFSTLQEASDVLSAIKKDAALYREEVVKEIEIQKEQGFQEGYAEGLSQWGEELSKFEQRLKEAVEDIQKKMVSVALKAAKKIVAKEIELSPETVVEIVMSQLKSVAQHKRITIYVNQKDHEVLEKNKPRLKELFENIEAFSIRPREDVAIGGCIIETEIGIINAQLDHRWSVLEKAFENLMKVSPETFK